MLRLLAATTLLLIAAPSPLRAQGNAQDSGVESNLPGAGFGASDAASSQPDPAIPTIHVYSRETVIDVLATDDKGQPVTGLTRDDFTVLEDNHPQPIRSFREYSITGPPPAPRQLPPNTYTNAQALPATGPVQIFYFILPTLIPALNPKPVIELGNNITRAKQYIADYLRTMPRGTEVAIFAFLPGEGLHLIQGFTTDGAHAAAEMDAMVVLRVRTANPGPSDPVAAADQIAAYVAGIRGRKNLIWIAPVPAMIIRDGGYANGASDMSKVHRMMDTYDRFTKEEIAIYPLNPYGVHLIEPPATPITESRSILSSEEVAEQTGGTAIHDTNDFKAAVAKIVDQSSHFYTISYVPTRPNADGHFHPISIKVSRPGVHLTYRTGYNDEQPRPPDPVLKERMKQGPMQFGALPTTQLLFDLEVTPTPPDAKAASVKITDKRHVGSAKDRSYDAVFHFDPTQIAFAETADGKRTADLEFDLCAYSPYGDLGPVRSQTIKVALNAAQYDEFMKTTFRFTLPIPLPHGHVMLRAGLFDSVANKSGTIEVPLDIPKTATPPSK